MGTDESRSNRYSLAPERIHGEPTSPDERSRREEYLEQLTSFLKLEADEYLSDPRLSATDRDWRAWQERTGELPPAFDRLPAIAALPDPLTVQFDHGRERITNPDEWTNQRERLAEQLQYWMYGELPPAPPTVDAVELESRDVDGATITTVRLEFGLGREATLDLEVMVPDGEGPFPVFLTQWNHRNGALLALQRGYMAVVYAGADARDDTESYGELYPEYDFQVLARRAWGAHRVVDYLDTHPAADCDRIGITGASRNGKQSLIAAAFDERIDAVVPCSAGSGAVVPTRFDRDDCYAGDASLHARLRRSWFHPRWRFFVGRENRLPVDTNSLVSLVAPRACMIHTAYNERTTSAWAVDRVYESALSVYELLDAEDQLALRYREGTHARTTRDIHHIIDFFDRTFDRGDFEDPTQRYHDYSFDRWCQSPEAQVETDQFPSRCPGTSLLETSGEPIQTVEEWEDRRATIRENLRWTLGEKPPQASKPAEPSFEKIANARGSPDFLSSVIGRPAASDTVGKLWISPSHASGERFDADLYYPRSGPEAEPAEKLPVIIWVHPFSHNTGYGAGNRGQVPIRAATDRGFALLGFDQLGFGTRIGEGRQFYERHPSWSKMGKLVSDTLAAVETVDALEFVDSDRIAVLGYSLGATVGLYAAALEDRIDCVATVGGISSFRATNASKERSHATISRLSHMHGLQPRLGLFLEEPERVPVDFDELLAAVAPRSVLSVAPSLDWTHPQDDVQRCVERAREVYRLYGTPDALELRTPDDILSFDYHEARLFGDGEAAPDALEPTRRRAVFDWLEEQV